MLGAELCSQVDDFNSQPPRMEMDVAFVIIAEHTNFSRSPSRHGVHSPPFSVKAMTSSLLEIASIGM